MDKFCTIDEIWVDSWQICVSRNVENYCTNVEYENNYFYSYKEMMRNRNLNIILAILSFLILTFLMYTASRIFKIIKWKNKVMLGMIICMNFQMASSIIFYSLNSEFYAKLCFDPNFNIGPIARTVFPILPAVFLSIAGFLNLNNWILYYVKIG